MNGELIEYRR